MALNSRFVILGPRTPERVCMSKQRYRSPAKARRATLRIKGRGGDIMDYYQCECCGGYHLTTVEER